MIVTDAAGEGMLDIHDRRPVVLEAADAELWLNPDLSPEEALDLARRAALPVDAFEWYKVTSLVNRPGVQDPQMALPLPD